MKRMLIVEDDDNLSRGIAFAFEKDGYTIICAPSYREGFAYFEQGNVDIAILDLNLPDGDGIKLCQKIRETSRIPVIMLTARDLETDEVEGLMAGADDYITKPFSLAVLRARVDALVRRTQEDAGDFRDIQSNGYRLNTAQCKLFYNDDEITVSMTEFRLLHYLMSNAGQVLSKEQILAVVWDNQGNFVDENALQVNINRLRSKIEKDPKKPKIIKTVHGLGYIWAKA